MWRKAGFPVCLTRVLSLGAIFRLKLMLVYILPKQAAMTDLVWCGPGWDIIRKFLSIEDIFAMRLVDHSWNSPRYFGEWAELLFFLMKCSVEKSLPEAVTATTTSQTVLPDRVEGTGAEFSGVFDQRPGLGSRRGDGGAVLWRL